MESEIEEGNKQGNICLFWRSDFQTLVLQPLVKGVLLGKVYRTKINLKQRKGGTVSVTLSILFLLAFIHHEDAVGSRVWKSSESESWHRRGFLNKTQQNLWEPTPSSPFPSVFPVSLVIVTYSSLINNSFGSICVLCCTRLISTNGNSILQIPRPAPFQWGHGIACSRWEMGHAGGRRWGKSC